ncbi:MAG: LysM peptidoglycan-binding domain-containing protein [Gemmatimonadetes bacterium]|nr:LysM peptidoglycan-binding domain-containing protein [Gemmatimonadota bacterium]
MVRSAAALVAVLILPSFAHGQVPQGTHTVVDDDTLWDLAIRYYDSPWEWRTIFEANRSVVEDPHWIFPEEVLVIPGLPGTATDRPPMETMPEPTDEPLADDVPSDLVPFGLRPARPVSEGARTIFYTDEQQERAEALAAENRDYSTVSADRVYSAPWLLRQDIEPRSSGRVAGFAEPGERGTTMRMFDQIRIEMPAPARVGANLQLFRITRTIPMVGRVARPVGVATVSVLGDGEVVAQISKVYDRIQAGDLVRALPDYTVQRGEYPEVVTGGSEAMIMGFAGDQVITDIGHIAFLDLGSDDGVAIGDEFILYGEAVTTETHGSLQVVFTTPTTASARVLTMDDDVWKQGVIVRLARKMR